MTGPTLRVRRTRPTVAGAAVLAAGLVLAGCGGSSGGTAATDLGETASVTMADEATASYPDGLAVTVTGVSRQPAALAYYPPEGTTLVRAELRLQDTRDRPLTLPNILPVSMLAGSRLRPAHADPGTSEAGDRVSRAAPASLAPHAAVVAYYAFDVPTADLGHLALTVSVQPGTYQPHTFTDLQTLLR